MALRAVLLWTALGFQLSWPKGSFSSSAEWIGAKMEQIDEESVVLELPLSKLQELAAIIRPMLKKPTIDRKSLRALAGKASWAASLLPQLRPFVETLWAALASEGFSPQAVWRRQAELGLRWLLAFATGSEVPPRRFVKKSTPLERIVIAFDASTTGVGAILWVLPAGPAPPYSEVKSLTPRSFFYAAWTEKDEGWAQAKRGDAGSQARWEAFGLLLAVFVWPFCFDHGFQQVLFIGDALGVLCGAVEFRAKDPHINKIFMELALCAAPTGACLSAEHIWSETNKLADDLSRVAEGASIPDGLRGVPEAALPTAPPFRLL